MKLTAAETFFMDRNRRRLTQAEQAQRIGLSPGAYRALEQGREKPDQRVRALIDDIMGGRTLEPHERVLLRRRRAGKLQREVASEIGCCRWWVVRMEKGLEDPTPLLKYWGMRAAG